MNTRETLAINKKDGHLYIGGADTVELAKAYGTPLYVFDYKYIEDICKAYTTTLQEEYEGYGQVLYASKAFSAVGIYQIIDNLGLGADIVSGGELFTALKAGISATKLVMHGNNKLYSELVYAISSGVKFIVADSFEEIKTISEIAQKYNKTQEILLRINPGIEAHTHKFVQTATVDSKFGFSIMNGDAEKAVSLAISAKNIDLKGLHCHIGSQIFEKDAFKIAVQKMTDFYKHIKDSLNYEFDVLNMGGGFGIYYTDEDKKVDLNGYKEYVKTIISELKAEIKAKNIKKPFLLLEPGRSIVGEAGITLYTVGRIKEIADIKNYISVDGGMFENPRFALYAAKYSAILAGRALEKSVKSYTIAGKCCESGDIIAENQFLPEAKEGDILAVLSTGAYNYSMASNYNRNLIPPVVIVKDGKADYLVKPQSYDDLIRNDNLSLKF